MHLAKQQEEGKKHLDMEGGAFINNTDHKEASTRHTQYSHQRVVDEPQRSRKHKSNNSSQSASDKSSSDSSLLKSHRHRGRSIEGNKSSTDGSNSFIPSPPRRAISKSGNARRDEAVSKFNPSHSNHLLQLGFHVVVFVYKR